MRVTGVALVALTTALTGCGVANSQETATPPPRPQHTAPRPHVTPPPPTTDPELVENADTCTAPDDAAVAGVRLELARGYRLTRMALHVTPAVGTDRVTGEASRYTYLAAELRRGGRLVGPAVWAAVNVHDTQGWLAVDTLAEKTSGWPSADGTDADVQRNTDDYSRAVSCAAEGGFPGGPPFSIPPDD